MSRRRWSPLGQLIARALGGTCRELYRWTRATDFGRSIEHAYRVTSHGAEPRDHALRDYSAAAGRRQLALALMLAECARNGYSAGCRVYQPVLARRLGVCVRTVQRDLDSLERAGLLRRWQPDASRVPEQLRGAARDDGQTWAYCVYRWCVALPREVTAALQRWRVGRTIQRAPEITTAGARPEPSPASVEHYAALAARALDLAPDPA